MAQATTDISRPRYTITQLLELSGTACPLFDLSKFSFDAARAGVVQSLSEYAMNSRRSSAQRPRECSSGSMTAVEPSLNSNRQQTVHPVRSPRLPPIDLRAQKDQGFAHFLKKHASPTHNRVTTGGRIVPMEPRMSPPAFSLGSQAQKSSSFLARSTGNIHERANGHNVSPPSQFKGQDQTVDFRNAYMSEEIHYDRHLTTENNAPGGQSAQTHLPGLSGLPFHPLAADHSMRAAASPTYPGLMSNSAALYSGFLPNVPYTMYGYPTMGMYPFPGTQPWPNSTSMTSPVEPPQPSFAQQGMINFQATAASSLAHWTQCFDELDRQLKMLDRQRATTSLNPMLSEQRRKIVQDRSDTKAIINKLQVFLGYAQQAANVSHDLLNVNAPSYVPATGSPQTQAQPVSPTAPVSEPVVSKTTHEDEKPKLPGAKRPIPIIPPPESLKAAITKAATKDELKSNETVDEWGVRVGQAPPELARQQKQMMDTLIEITESPSSKGSNALRILQTPRKSYSENDAQVRRSLDTDTSEDEAWVPQRVQAPPHVEATYKLQMDALRLLPGSITMIKMPNGTTMKVEGQNLQRPPTATMSDFEKRYWAQASSASNVSVNSPAVSALPALKPTPVKTGSPANIKQRPILIDGENIAAAPVGHRKAATDAFLAQYNSDTMEDPPSSPDDTESLRDLGLAQNGRNQFILRDIYGAAEQADADDSLAILDAKRLRNNPFHVPNHHEQPSEPRQYEVTSKDAGLSAESMFNKGYSSVSTQSVHAVADPPQYVDGPNDHKKSARTLLGITKKCKSPRLVQRAGPNGGAWFGPFRRDVGIHEPKSPTQDLK